MKELSHCDNTKLCLDGSDFHRCDNTELCLEISEDHRCDSNMVRERHQGDIPMIIDFKPAGLNRLPVPPGRGSRDSACPETHFWCPDKDYCLPVYVRCNGVNDCPGHEDEEGCDTYTCPGFYRCRATKVCVHVDHVCDDWPVCPQHDDELLCNLTCPSQCTCHGLAFFCGGVFAVHGFPDLRYLDVRGSGINVHQLGDNHMLVHLGLARCRVRTVSNFSFPNLQSLDLNDNLLKEVRGDQFVHMPHLTVLFLAGNLLTSVLTSSSTQLHKIHTLDLSRVELHTVDPSLFTVFPQLQNLNLSHSGVEMLHWNSSQMSMDRLQELDLRGNVIAEFSRDVLRGCVQLQLLLTDNFKLCCPSVLPPAFDLNHCHARQDDVSSCDDLLGSETYRGAVAFLAILAVLGNIVSLTLRVSVRNTWQLSSGDVVLTHLSVADLGMGLYLATLGMADRLLPGHYVWQDVAWRRGVVCQLAGVLAIFCRHAATFFITILSLDSFLHRCFALDLRHMITKVKIICVVIWAASLLLTAVPLILELTFFGQQALCVRLLHKRDGSLESHYVFGTMVLLHLAMFAVSYVYEVVPGVCSRVRKSSIMNKDTRADVSQFLMFGSLTSGFLYTITCLVPTDAHTDRQTATHTALVYFGCVVSCAMNPYLHLYGIRVERAKRIKEERLMRIVNRARI